MHGKWKLVFLVAIIGIIILIGISYQTSKNLQPKVRLYLSHNHKVIELPLETYLMGVVGAEMPASFGAEALKAQAVTARTYTLKKLYSSPKHPGDANMCDDINCCQAYIDPAGYKKEWGQDLYENRFEPVKKAVSATRGEVLVYKNDLIDTPYFSTCGGRTASAKEVWGKEVPYLKSVKCSFCQQSKRFSNTTVIKLTEVNSIIHQPARKAFKFKVKVLTASGRLDTALVDGRIMKGQDLRRLFNLSSTQIIAQQQGNKVIFLSKGYGHGVGLCQYGAAGMGQKGYEYKEILRHYYQKVDLIRLAY